MAERTKAQQVDQAGYTRRDLATLQKKRVGGCARSIGPELNMIAYAILTSDGTLLATISTENPPTLEQMADYCAEINGFADRDEWMYEARIEEIAYAPLH
ncbi:hypothetical protein LGM71_19210 [Burkholderia sp. AU33545]|uniref:hypothetical protein n=1 Tax=Burkholderia sp. AU33545 TaxID=2879631 RepID=UPI001CF4141C|nr:hypothetical protein [Burkholderia sp. AU33545]MCA8203184.1 hypothetical protein [Burkholderia sp. AU33545]